MQFQLDGSLALNYVIFKADRIFSPSAIYHPALLEHQYLGKAEESEGVEPKTGSTPRTLQRYQSCCRCHSTLSLKTRGSKRGFSHFWVVGWQARDTGEHWPIEFFIRWKEMSGLLQLQRITNFKSDLGIIPFQNSYFFSSLLFVHFHVALYYHMKINEALLRQSSKQDVCFDWMGTLGKCTRSVASTTSSLIRPLWRATQRDEMCRIRISSCGEQLVWVPPAASRAWWNLESLI